MPPVRFGALMPGSASITLSGSVVPAFFTASTHMAKPMTCASIGSLVTRFGFLVKACHLEMNSLFADGERHHRNVGRLDALIAEFLVERHVGVAVDGRDHGRLLAFGAELFDR